MQTLLEKKSCAIFVILSRDLFVDYYHNILHSIIIYNPIAKGFMIFPSRKNPARSWFDSSVGYIDDIIKYINHYL